MEQPTFIAAGLNKVGLQEEKKGNATKPTLKPPNNFTVTVDLDAIYHLMLNEKMINCE